MEVGRVLWFSESKEFGYIEHEDGREIYFHYTAVDQRNKRRQVKVDMGVRFDLVETQLGWEASKVRGVNELDAS